MAVITSDTRVITTPQGLSTQEVQERVKRGETNNYQPRVNRSYWDIFRDNVLNLFNIVLFLLLLFVLFMQDYGTVVVAGMSVVSNTILGMIQEMNSKRKLDNLAAMTVQNAFVWRDGQKQEIPMRQVVKDDILILEPGIKAVVDGEVLVSDALEINESMLTGESDAVFKEPGHEVFSGSFCVAGTGLMRATRVGKNSNINQLSEIAKAYKNVRTPTQKRIDIFVELSVAVMVIFVPLLFIRDLWVVQPPLQLLDAVRNVVVFVTTLVPQGLVLTGIMSLTLGAIKISQQQTLVQKVNAVESLANVTVLCFDKTGTLTKNELAVDEIIPLNSETKAQIIQQLADYLDNLAHLNRTALAIKEFTATHTSSNGTRKIREVPFTSERKWGAVIFENETLILGASERMLHPEHPAIQQSVELSQQGKRVLAFASMEAEPNGNHIMERSKPIALVVLSDNIREDIQDTLQAFRDEDIQLKVISGDNIETVKAIAGQAGMDTSVAYTGDQIDAMTDSELEIAVSEASAFARINPHTKQRVISALQRRGEYVAMVGDGVNDVPALKQAELAIVMNDGTQISKDIADIVLLNNAMSTLPLAFREGRTITQTIFASTKLFLSRAIGHIPFYIFVLFMALPFPNTPIQISWLTFGSLNIPAMFITLLIFHPKFMRNFRDDVMDYSVIGGVIAAATYTLLFTITYFATERNIYLARNASMIYQILLNSYIVMTIVGVDFYQPKTFITQWRTVATMTGLATVTIWASYLVPAIVGATPLTFASHPLIIVLITALLALSMVLIAHFSRRRYLLHRLWALAHRDDYSLDGTRAQR
jgi:cation-transporting P-type ATPase E